jgi:hypothetical protein
VGGGAEADARDEVDELAELVLVEGGQRVDLGQGALERGVVGLDGVHGVVEGLADGGLLGLALEVGPARCWGTQNTFSAVYSSRSSRARRARPRAPGFLMYSEGVWGRRASDRTLAALLEGVGDVLEEDQPEHDVLVLGRVHVVAQHVGRRPQLVFEAERAGLVVVVPRHQRVSIVIRRFSSRQDAKPPRASPSCGPSRPDAPRHR